MACQRRLGVGLHTSAWEFSGLDGMMHRCCLRLLDSPALRGVRVSRDELRKKVPGRGRIVPGVQLDVAPMSKPIGRSAPIGRSY
jgi:hypothetical protein